MLASLQSLIQSIEQSKIREEKENKEPSSKKGNISKQLSKIYPFLVYTKIVHNTLKQ
jgi:hypothetical protein